MHAPGQATTSNKSTALAAGAVARNSSVTPLSSARTRAQGRPRGRTACATPITSRRSCRPRALRACAGKGLPCVAFRALLFARSRQATRPAGAANQCNGASSEQRCQRSRDKVHMGCERHFGPAPATSHPARVSAQLALSRSRCGVAGAGCGAAWGARSGTPLRTPCARTSQLLRGSWLRCAARNPAPLVRRSRLPVPLADAALIQRA
jgi:hypothetical protein